jgi:hypothetical protein
VAETIDPSSNPSSSVIPKIQVAASPAIAAVISVPGIASASDAPITGLISRKPTVKPPSKRIRPRAITPMVRASW